MERRARPRGLVLLVNSVLVWTVLLSGRAFAMRSLAGIVLELLAAFGQRECKLALVFEALDPGTAADLDFRFLLDDRAVLRGDRRRHDQFCGAQVPVCRQRRMG